MKNIKKTVIVCAVILLLCALLSIGLYCYSQRIPSGCDQMTFRMDCMQLSAESLPEWEGDIQYTLYRKNNAQGVLADGDPYMRRIAAEVRRMPAQKRDTMPHDVQLVEFAFGDQNGAKEIYRVAYDFERESLHLYKNGVWYQTEERSKLNQLITELIDKSASYPMDLQWRGQSTYAMEEYVETDWENASFRYGLYWRPAVNVEKRLEFRYRDSDFRNVTPSIVRHAEDAIALAAAELCFETPVGFTFYDEISGYWMVELYDDSGVSMEPGNESGEFLNRNVYTVIMDEQGIIKETYQGVTRYAAFWWGHV